MNRRLARMCNIDGSDEIVFELPPPKIIATLTDYPRTFEDWFKLMEPHFDIRLVPNVGIVTGKYYHEVLANQEDK